MNDPGSLCLADTWNWNMKTDLAKAPQTPHQAFENHNCQLHFSALFISQSGVTIKGICLAISVLKIIKQFT